MILKDQDAVLNRWGEYFGDLLNPVDAKHRHKFTRNRLGKIFR